MRFCEECGAALEDDAKFCEECGTPVETLEEEAEPTVVASEEKDEKKDGGNVADENVAIEVDLSAFAMWEDEVNSPTSEDKAAGESVIEKEQPQNVSVVAPAVEKEQPKNEAAAAPAVEKEQPQNEAVVAKPNVKKLQTNSTAAVKTPTINERTEGGTVPQEAKKKMKTSTVVLITLGITLVAVIGAGIALNAMGIINLGDKIELATSKTSETDVEPAGTYSSNKTNQTQETQEDGKVQTDESAQNQKAFKRLQEQWDGVYTQLNQYGSELLIIEVDSEDVFNFTDICYDYDGDETYRQEMTATFISSENTAVVDNYDGSTFYAASISADGNTVTTYDEEGNPYQEYVSEEIQTSENRDEYIIPDSSERKLTMDDIVSLSREEMRLARNEIYARHGRMFNDEELQAYFDSQSWYQGTILPEDFNEQKEFSDVERANVKFISKYE